jgi:TonB-linked SusC/RagA family outer membrane protein
MKIKRLTKQLLVLALFMLATGSMYAQNVKVEGTVLEGESQSPLPGVTIQVKNTGTGTLTDFDGTFSLEVAPQDILVFSFVGFASQEVLVGEKRIFNIILNAESTRLGEVLVIGYGTQSRANITSSVAKMDTRILESAPRSNVGSALQGAVPGLRVINNTGSPGATPSILLRGGASINNPGSPLVIVDGIIRAFNDISPDDIESIEILKDAAATSIYGARANNGVILITTKQAKLGTAQVTYKYVFGLNVDRPDYKYLNAKDYIYYSRLGHFNSQRTLAQVNSQRGFGLFTDPANLASFDIRRFDATNANLLQQGWDTVPDPYGGTIIFKDHSGEIRDIVFRNSRTNDHYLNVSGGNERGKYFASFNYYDEEGIIVGSDYRRLTANLNGSYRIKPNLEISSGATFSTATQFGAIAGDVNTMYRNLSLWPTFNPWLDEARTIPNPGTGIADGNPLYWLQKNQRTNEVNRITGFGTLNYKIAEGLSLKATANFYLFENTNESFTQATQIYTQIFTNPQVFNTNRPSSYRFDRLMQTQYNAVLNYEKTLAARHNLNAMIGVESFGQKFLNVGVTGTGAPTDDIPTINASTVFAPGGNFTNKSEYAILSNFGRINYDYDKRFLLSLVYRYDGVSSLAEANRWGFFPGMSAGWNIHKERFFTTLGLDQYVKVLKPRVSYGTNGNVAGIGLYEVQGAYGSQGNYNNNLGFLNTGVINSGLRWEKSNTLDIGLDMGILNNRVTFIADYYDRRTTDLLTNLTLPSYTGFGSIRTNLGTLQNKGLELGVDVEVLQNPNGLNLTVSGNVAFNQNKILELPFNGNEFNRQGGFQVYDPKTGKLIWVTGLQEGMPLGEVYAFKQVSIFQSEEEILRIARNRWDAVARISGPERNAGLAKITPGDVNWLDVDQNDTIDTRDQVYIGNINPKFFGGFSLNFSYKRVNLFTRFDFAGGHVIYNDYMARILGNYQGTFNNLELIKQGFSGDNSRPDIPKIYWADQVGAPNGKQNLTRINNAGSVLQSNNSNLYERGDYIGLREITLSYDFNPTLVSKSRVFSQLRAYVNVNNLLYISRFSGNSPEPKENGIFAGNYPTPRSFVFGIQTTLK